MTTQTNRLRRRILQLIAGAGSVFAAGAAAAHHTETHMDDDAIHHIVYQCNQADPEYLQHILFSVAELLRKYGDDIEIVVACFGPGLHLLGKHPGRPVSPLLQERASSLAYYGVDFHACGNTMKTLKWSAKDLLPFADVVPIGVDDVMQLQERGFAYLSW